MITTLALVEVQPFASVVVKVYVPDVVTEIELEVAPVLHVLPDVALEVKVAVCGAQIDVCDAVIVGVGGSGFVVTTTAADVAEQPLAPTVTV